ncbi:hypothetical protein A4D02_23490 [Niastella koreensis]|uniref:Membrane-flanked domain DUF304 n=3 Tax=Niastella koreensis TaxID=354356 RepID=G8TAV2_NIAKG|nr:PH domain-containing protein [Niastella koreensis]AEW00295.1 membrane-flanked domain DUF304 [Niastella koreensis GR20-10]OQP52163.1 hypothetical protein A4D02_23490 [Niastella koreensis]
MTSTPDNSLLPEFESVKDYDEEILWTGKPKLLPYILNGIGPFLFTLLIAICWISFTNNFMKASGTAPFPLIWLGGLVPLVFGSFAFLNRLLSYRNTAYAYSNKRIMIRTGFIGTDFKTVDYDKIVEMEVRVNVIERMNNVGTIRFFSGSTQTDDGHTTKTYDKWIAIENPYEVFKLVKQTAVDIKTDYNYPNALRPETNPGHKTKYDRKD